MRKKFKKKKRDWIYDPIVVKGILQAKKEVDEIIKRGGHLPTMDELLDKFQKDDIKRGRK